MSAERDERGVFELLRDGRDIARQILENWVSGDLAAAVNALEAWAGEADGLLSSAAAEYAQAVCDAPEVGDTYVIDPNNTPPSGVYSQAYADQMRTALLTIARKALTDTALLPDLIAEIAHKALMPSAGSPPPPSGDLPLPNGSRLYWETDPSINCRVYSSDEIGGGVHVWNPALIAPSTLLAAIVCEEQLGNLEVIHARRRNEGTMRQSAQTFSIFGQIEAAAAEHMIERGEITRIEPEHIPVSVRFNERNESALFAVIVPADKVERFEKIIADLRA